MMIEVRSRRPDETLGDAQGHGIDPAVPAPNDPDDEEDDADVQVDEIFSCIILSFRLYFSFHWFLFFYFQQFFMMFLAILPSCRIISLHCMGCLFFPSGPCFGLCVGEPQGFSRTAKAYPRVTSGRPSGQRHAGQKHRFQFGVVSILLSHR
jgi:hypothetical protein